MANKPCLTCGAASPWYRCAKHGKNNGRGPSAHARGLGRRHANLRKQVIEEWVAAYGWLCPGYDVPAHPVPVNGLEGDHIIPRTVRPDLTYERSNYAVLCRRCNVKKGNKVPS